MGSETDPEANQAAVDEAFHAASQEMMDHPYKPAYPTRGTDLPRFNVPLLPPSPAADQRLDTFDKQVEAVTRELATMLITKNRAYGNSALNPVRVFSRSDTDEQLRVRIDDKLSRLARGKGTENEDVLMDLLGYIAILIMHRRYGSGE